MSRNYAFIDSQNLHLSIQRLGWKLDYARFRVYLQEKYGVERAFLFLGYHDQNAGFYNRLKSYGFEIVFKPTVRNRDGILKGNCDAELVLHCMWRFHEFQSAIIVSGDGDFHCLVEHLARFGKLRALGIPDERKYSSLLRGFHESHFYVSSLRKILEYKKREAFESGRNPHVASHGVTPLSVSDLSLKSSFHLTNQNWQLIRDGKLDRDTFVQRARIFGLIREWFRKEGFLEVETPLMVKHPGMEPHLNLFSTEFVSEDGKFRDKRYLHTSPEYAMKKLLGAGFEKIFQMTKVFRNGEIGNADFRGCSGGDATGVNYCVQPLGENESRHNPEFTMLEWYRVNEDYRKLMEDTEGMIRWISRQLAERSLQFEKEPWERLSIREAFQKYAGLDLDELRKVEDFRSAVAKKPYASAQELNWDDLFFLVMLNDVEPNLRKEGSVFLYDYPASQAALSKKKEEDPFWAERFELYIGGVELCNTFTELVDPAEQRQRLVEEQEQRRQMGKEAYAIDETFLEALATMPPSAGSALGIDRLVMVLLGKKSIEEVLLFPWGDVS